MFGAARPHATCTHPAPGHACKASSGLCLLPSIHFLQQGGAQRGSSARGCKNPHRRPTMWPTPPAPCTGPAMGPAVRQAGAAALLACPPSVLTEGSFTVRRPRVRVAITGRAQPAFVFCCGPGARGAGGGGMCSVQRHCAVHGASKPVSVTSGHQPAALRFSVWLWGGAGHGVHHLHACVHGRVGA